MEAYTQDFFNALRTPSKQFGEVPFYWWSGDKLDKDRLRRQIELLSENGVAGVQINYAHDYKNNGTDEPYGGYGMSLKGSPVQFSDEWWDFFEFAAKECEKHGMGIGVGDYTIAWIGNGYFVDKIASTDGMQAQNISCEKKLLFGSMSFEVPDDAIAVISYEKDGGEQPVILWEKNAERVIYSDINREIFIISINTTPLSIDPMNPMCGKMLVDIYFSEFERRVPSLKKGTLNYFFQDELMFGADVKTLWSDLLRQATEQKYGYDPLGYLPHMFFNLGNITPKIRLNIADVRTQLIEDGYFKPIYAFHSSRGMIYGCDQSSRGRKPAEFSDYFRTVRWFTAPGNDTPGRSSDLIKVKVNSSIAHLYNRPRVWLEGYHSSGWGTTLESITKATSNNFIFGANLLNLHGLYYSTNGGFFEWAPPDFHFRMPYWDDEKYWLLQYKRLAQLLTTGSHRCDAAVFYPVSSCDYGENDEKCVSCTFEAAEYIYSKGIDFDFMDFQSFENSKCRNGCIEAASEKYRILIFCAVDTIRYSTVIKIKEFLDCGGAVAFVGITPYISDRAGMNDPVLANDIIDILSHPSCRLLYTKEELSSFINERITRSFLPEENSGEKVYVHRRVHGKDNLFFVRYAKADSVCRFEATGVPYLFDIHSGKCFRLTGTVTQNGFTFIKMPSTANGDTLILFTESCPDADGEINTSGFSSEDLLRTYNISDNWAFGIVPTLDNTYGDFYLPSGGFVGAEARFFDCGKAADVNTVPSEFEYKNLPYCRSLNIRFTECKGNVLRCCELLASSPELISQGSFTLEDKSFTHERFNISDRYGFVYSGKDYETGLFEQGHHGLKGKIFDDNIYFSDDCVCAFGVLCESDTTAFPVFGGISPDYLYVNGSKFDLQTASLKLHKGINYVVAGFIYDAEKADKVRNRGKIKRSALMFAKTPSPANTGFPLSKCDFANSDFLPLTADSCTELYCLRFETFPGFCGFEGGFFGTLERAVSNGCDMEITALEKGFFGENMYKAITAAPHSHTGEVVLYLKVQAGKCGTGSVPQPLKLISDCGTGTAGCRDNSTKGALRCFSGKLVYEKTVEIEKLDTDERFVFNAACECATLKLEINGVTAEIFTYKPYTADITQYLINGSNIIKLTLSTTLSNHYSTIPSRYSNFPEDSATGLGDIIKIDVLR